MALGKPTRVVEDNCGVHQATVLIRLRASWRKKTAEDVSMEKLNPQVRRPLFLHQNWRFAMAKPWICANYADGKNSAGMFVSCLVQVKIHIYVLFVLFSIPKAEILLPQWHIFLRWLAEPSPRRILAIRLWARMAGWFRWFTGDMGNAAELKMTHFQTKSSWSWMDRVWGTTVVGQWDLLNGRTEESRNHKAIAFYESMGDKQSRLRPKRQRSVWAEWSFMTKNIFCPDSMVWQFPVILESFYRPRHHQFLRLLRGV